LRRKMKSIRANSLCHRPVMLRAVLVGHAPFKWILLGLRLHAFSR